MRSRFATEEVGTDVQNHKAEAVTKLANQPLDESRGDPRPELELRRTADD